MSVYIIYIAIIGFFALKIFKTPSSALVLAGFMFAFEQWAQASSRFFLSHQSLTNIVIGVIVALAVIICWFRGSISKGFYPKTGYLIICFLLYALISIFWSPSFDISYMQWKQAIPYIITITLLAPLTIKSSDDLHPMFSGMVLMGAIITALLLFMVEWNGRFIVFGNDRFGENVTGNPLAIGQLGGTLAFLGFFYRFKNEIKIWRLLRWGVVLLGLMLVIKSGSRGQLVAAIFLMFGFWFLDSPSKNIFKPLLGLLVLAVLLLAVKYLVDMYWLTERVGDSRRFSNENIVGDIGGRFHSAFVLLGVWIESPFSILFGLGNSASYHPNILGLYPHMVPLEVLGEEGLIGFMMYFMVFFRIVSGSFKSFKKIKNDNDLRNLFICLISLWSYSFILTLKQGSMLLAQDYFLYSMLLIKFNDEIKNKK